jgi:uncharacterized membrane protein
MKPTRLIFSILVVLSLSLANCSKSKDTKTDTEATIPDGSCTTAQAPHFTTVQTIFSTNCDSCHGHNFATYANALGAKNSIFSYVNAGSMPQNSTLSQADKDAILQWAACGAVN